MKAFIKQKYGGPEVLLLKDIKKPCVENNHLLIKVMANSANPADWHILRGKPFFARFSFGLFKPKHKILGSDIAGVVEEVGSNIQYFKVGDKVYGETLLGGGFAEYINIDANCCGKMAKAASFTEMACVPIAGQTALQALLTHGKLAKGESVLINGSSGGVGHFAVQIAKAYGAKVTAVCSHKNTKFVKSLGADKTIAYDQEDIHKHTGQYNLVVDTHGNLSFQDYKRMGERGVMVGFTTITHMISTLLQNAFHKYNLVQFTAEASTKDLETLSRLIEKKQIKIHIEKIFSYKEIPAAIRYIEAMHTVGKVAMSWEGGSNS